MSEPWEWTESAIRASVGEVRAGRSLAPDIWPHDCVAAVALSFDCDHETITLRDGQTAPGKLSQGEYGYADSGHEVALHGWIHERNAELPPHVERDLTLRAADTLERTADVEMASYVADRAGLGR